MRKGKTIRINEDLMDLIQRLADIYRNDFSIKVNPTNIMEKLVVNGFSFYIADVKEREKLSPNPDALDKICEIENRLLSLKVNEGKGKVISFITEEQLHDNIELLAKIESSILKQNILYNSLVTGMIVKGADYYISLFEGVAPLNELKTIKQIKDYIHSLDLSLGKLIKNEPVKESVPEKNPQIIKSEKNKNNQYER